MAIDRKQQIFSTARTLFSERGYPATTVRDIARELNMQAGSLYTHIDSKEDVLWEIVDRAARRFLEAAEPIARREGSCRDKLRDMVRAHVAVVAGSEGDATIFLNEWKYLGETRRTSVAERRRHYEALYRQVLDDGIARSEFAPTDPKIAALMVLSVMNWMPQWYNAGGPLSAREIADRFCDLILKGLEAS